MSPSRPAQRDPGPLPGKLHGVLEPIVREAGFELDDLDVRSAGRRHTVRVVVDSDTGVGLDDIARVSRAASAVLDRHEHLIGGSYTLEVTSPGAERPLRLQRHWRRAHLRKVVVRTVSGTSFTARVGASGPVSVTVLVEGATRELRYDEIAHAAVEVEFRPPPAEELRKLGAVDRELVDDPEGSSDGDVDEQDVDEQDVDEQDLDEPDVDEQDEAESEAADTLPQAEERS